MNHAKHFRHFKLLTATPAFAERIAASGAKASALQARLVYSWLVHRSRLDLGSSTRSICKQLGMHPTTVASALDALRGLIERKTSEWIALPPAEDLFFTFLPQ